MSSIDFLVLQKSSRSYSLLLSFIFPHFFDKIEFYDKYSCEIVSSMSLEKLRKYFC